MFQSDNQRTANDDGFALVSVLWALVLLSGFAVALTLAVRSRTQTAAYSVGRGEATILADGIADLIANDWATPEKQIAEHLGLKEYTGIVRCKVDDQVIDIRVMSAAGLVDLNMAPGPLLARLFRAFNVSQADARALADAVLDFRDADSDREALGAEAVDYAAAGYPHGPKNAPFETITELDQVYGFSQETFQAVRRYITVHARSPFVDRSAAPSELVEALQRAATGESAGDGIEVFGQAPLSSRTLRMLVAVETPRGVRVVRDAMAELAPQSRRGFLWRDWSLFREDRQSAAGSARTLRECF